ncbi:MAG: phosphoglycerate kinase [Candidatus Doudnabacteria bacterium]|nr:phosphoglycerate kinase [Candidatus Doudnabacteria bacterium]
MIRSITSVKVSGRRVFIRAGFDVPLKDGRVADDARIKDALPTLRYLIDQRAKIIIGSHLNRPNGWNETKSLWPVAEKLGEFLNYKVVKVTNKLPDYPVPHIYFFTQDITKGNYADLTRTMRGGDILMLENLRFYPGEQENSEEFAKALAQFADVFVNEAFSNAHRKDASVFSLPNLLPAYAGIDFLREIQALNQVAQHPQKPMVLLIGGAKISDKVETIENLADKVDYILVGGRVGNTFLKAAGYDVGKSETEDEVIAKHLLRNYKNKIVLPADLVVAKSVDDVPRAVTPDKIRPTDIILDIGPASIRKFSQLLKSAKTLVWNGPFGVIEKPKFAFGSKGLAQAFASRSKGQAFGLVGGGETVELIHQAKVEQFIDHISTAGGAMLEFLSGKQLPAIKALERNNA